ncbi:MAG: hypothetical protein GVY36_06295 [Verrucomicrobia bacterium]|jgi:hypothetical protein|nr:hypothetical protein [Verrucomicrobiota bacterium]
MSDENQPSPESVAIDKALRIAELQAELASLTGEPIRRHLADDTEVDSLESWKAGLDAIESGSSMPLYDILQLRRKFIPTPLSCLKDRGTLSEQLWLLIYALATIRVFIDETDHLSDPELYDLLLNKLLPQATTLLPEGSGWNCRYSVCDLSDDGDPHQSCYLRYYADDATRHMIAEEYPGATLPPKEEPPYDRDAFLPGF